MTDGVGVITDGRYNTESLHILCTKTFLLHLSTHMHTHTHTNTYLVVLTQILCVAPSLLSPSHLSAVCKDYSSTAAVSVCVCMCECESLALASSSENVCVCVCE